MQIDGVIHGRMAMQIQKGGSPNRKARMTKQRIGKGSCASANSMRPLYATLYGMQYVFMCNMNDNN